MSHRLLLATTSLMRGGAESQVYLLARSLAKRGHTVEVVSMRDPEAFYEELEADGVPVHSLGMRPGIPDPRALVRLGRIVTRFRPDVVHSHMVHANLLARVSRLFTPVPVLVSTAHSFNEGARWRELAYRLTDPLCDLTTNVCRAAVERFLAVGAVPHGRIECVWNGVDVRDLDERVAAAPVRPAAARDGGFTWLAVGNLGPAKDYPTLLRSMRRLKDSGDPGSLAIVGSGDDRSVQELERALAALDLGPDRVRYLGSRHNVPALMSQADGFVMSSAWEGLPMVLLEASAERLPIVATAVGGNEEVVAAGATGILVPPGDPEALAAAMRRVMHMSPDQRRSWGDAGRAQVVRNFDIERIVDRWEELYATFSGASAGRRRRIGRRG